MKIRSFRVVSRTWFESCSDSPSRIKIYIFIRSLVEYCSRSNVYTDTVKLFVVTVYLSQSVETGTLKKSLISNTIVRYFPALENRRHCCFFLQSVYCSNLHVHQSPLSLMYIVTFLASASHSAQAQEYTSQLQRLTSSLLEWKECTRLSYKIDIFCIIVQAWRKKFIHLLSDDKSVRQIRDIRNCSLMRA